MADAEQQPTPMLCELVDLHQLYESAVYNMPEESLHQFTEVRSLSVLHNADTEWAGVSAAPRI